MTIIVRYRQHNPVTTVGGKCVRRIQTIGKSAAAIDIPGICVGIAAAGIAEVA